VHALSLVARALPIGERDGAQHANHRAVERPQLEIDMNWDQIEGNWKQFKGKVKEKWGKLTDDELEELEGNRDQLVGRIQEQYGISKDEAEKQLRDWAGKQQIR